MKTNKPQMNTKVVNEKAATSAVCDINITTMAIDNCMAVIQVLVEIQLMMFAWIGDLG